MRQNALARFDRMHVSSHAKGRLTRARNRSSATHDAAWLGCVPLATVEFSLYDTHTISYSSPSYQTVAGDGKSGQCPSPAKVWP
jgi:hypothetical protein